MMESTTAPSNHTEHQKHISPWTWGIAGGLGAITLAPYLLPLAGIGASDSANGIMHIVSASPTGNPLGTGLAATVQSWIGAIPGIGGALTSTAPVTILGTTMASGALVSLAATAAIGIGGVLLANWMEKHEKGGEGIRWSKVVRYTALATSALIALPGVLGALSVGITFLAGLMGPAGTSSYTALAMQDSLGATNMHAASGAAGGLAVMASHLLTCGLSALPVVGAVFMHHQSRPKPELPPQPRLAGPAQLQGRLQMAPQAHAMHMA